MRVRVRDLDVELAVVGQRVVLDGEGAARDDAVGLRVGRVARQHHLVRDRVRA